MFMPYRILTFFLTIYIYLIHYYYYKNKILQIKSYFTKVLFDNLVSGDYVITAILYV